MCERNNYYYELDHVIHRDTIMKLLREEDPVGSERRKKEEVKKKDLQKQSIL